MMLWPAIWNGFPLLFTDTLSYAISGFDLVAPLDRPIFYGLFLRSTGIGGFLWASIFIQALIISFLIFQLGKILSPFLKIRTLIALILITSIFTNLAWFVDQLIPDIFSSILFLGLLNLFLGWDKLSKIGVIFLFFLIVLSISVHSSNVPIAFILIISMGILLLTQNKSNPDFKNILLFSFSAFLFSVLILVSSNIQSHQTPTLNKSGKIFVLAKMLEDGTALDYLNQNCQSIPYKSCKALALANEAKNTQLKINQTQSPKLKNLIASSFLWGGGINLAGGFYEVNSEAGLIIKNSILANPFGQIKATFLSFLDQLVSIDVGEQFQSTRLIEPINDLFNIHYPALNGSYMSSKQYAGFLSPFPAILNKIYNSFILLGALLWIYILYLGVSFPRQKIIYFIAASLLVFLAINALITGGMSGVFDRYQSRIIWLVPTLGLLAYFCKKNRKYSINNTISKL